MKQNNYFSLKRFVSLLRNDWLIHQKTYLFTVLGLVIALYGLSYFLMYTTRHFTNNQYTGLFMFYLMGIGAITGTGFPALKDQIKRSNYLLTPGSVLEKFMVQFFIRMVIFIPLSLFIFWMGVHLAKATLVAYPPQGYDPALAVVNFHYSELFNDVPTLRDKFMIVISFFSVASLLFAGSAFFNRFALAKTLIVLGIIFAAVLLTFVLFSHIFYPGVTRGFNIELQSYKIWDNMYNIQLFLYLLGGLSWLFFLPLAYFKLKEKEV